MIAWATWPKTCPRCHETKASTEFAHTPYTSDGRASWCRVCNRAAQRSWRERHRVRHVYDPIAKQCLHCREVKPPSAFSRRKSSPDGLQGYCRDCFKLYQQWRKEQRRGQSEQGPRLCA